MSSIGSPLMTLAAIAFTMLLQFSSSVALSESASHNRPPSSSPFHTPPPATKNGSLPRPPRPLKENHGYRNRRLRPPPPPPPPAKKRELNKGKLVGLVFAGIAVILQIGAVGFLAFKRNQLYKVRD